MCNFQNKQIAFDIKEVRSSYEQLDNAFLWIEKFSVRSKGKFSPYERAELEKILVECGQNKIWVYDLLRGEIGKLENKAEILTKYLNLLGVPQDGFAINKVGNNLSIFYPCFGVAPKAAEIVPPEIKSLIKVASKGKKISVPQRWSDDPKTTPRIRKRFKHSPAERKQAIVQLALENENGTRGLIWVLHNYISKPYSPDQSTKEGEEMIENILDGIKFSASRIPPDKLNKMEKYVKIKFGVPAIFEFLSR